MDLVFSIDNIFITKTSLANKWTRKKFPFCSDSALVYIFCKLISFSDVQIQLLEAKEEDQKPKPKPRDQWSKEIEFLLASIGYCVGVGNIWR